MASQQLRRIRRASTPGDVMASMTKLSSSHHSTALSDDTGVVGSVESEVKCCFRGANEELEIEDYSEFLLKIKNKDVSKLASYGDWIFQEVDFSAETPQSWACYNFQNCWFWGCTLPIFCSVEEQLARGRPFHEWLIESDDIDEICSHFLRHATDRKLPLRKNFSQLSEEHWKK